MAKYLKVWNNTCHLFKVEPFRISFMFQCLVYLLPTLLLCNIRCLFYLSSLENLWFPSHPLYVYLWTSSLFLFRLSKDKKSFFSQHLTDFYRLCFFSFSFRFRTELLKAFKHIPKKSRVFLPKSKPVSQLKFLP